MSATITKYFGHAMTGQGMKNVYQDLLNESSTVYFFKGPQGFKLSSLLQEIGDKHLEKGFDVEFYYDPLFENTVEAIFVRSKNTLYLGATNPSIEPTLLGTRDQIISLYECFNKEYITANGEKISQLVKESEKWHNQCFGSLSSALRIHDDWEVETQRHMDWKGLNAQIGTFLNDLFGAMELNKEGTLTHRLLGTLTPNGARDTLQDITKNLERRVFIKGYPGTGKSSLMKKIAKDALARGFDVQMVWCGLDSKSIDMVILPEIKFCIFDSTEPHVYFPDESRKGDEIFDIAKHCKLTAVEEKNIMEIVSQYRKSMNNAIEYAGRYASAIKELRQLVDDAIVENEWEVRTASLLNEI
ncbi:hypothetical protein JOD29_002945 [Lysinibacillus composti]|nr:nucleotide kinase [Lysinibacillus composti]MBM7609669.1 hypothetical protein [Lysinibacillus composti]